jgi:hypothetical protein
MTRDPTPDRPYPQNSTPAPPPHNRAPAPSPQNLAPDTLPPHNGALYAACIFLSAFLLFEVQPLVAKEILPWFGGSAAVWTTCMLFFQMVLLAGYGYAHWLGGRRHWVHAGVLLAGVLLCRIIPWATFKPAGASHPLNDILVLLSVTVGVPYFMLAATSPLLQNWYARQHRGTPYRFFALSNLASMLALLSYPLLIEPLLALHVQAWAWSGAFLVCAALNFALYRSVSGAAPVAPTAAEQSRAPRVRERLLWVALPACASALLLAVTNHITQNIAAIPLFWVVPLAVYLLSFILTFDDPRWYRRSVWLAAFAALVAAMGYAVDERADIQQLAVLMPLFIGGLFACCMVCHGELAGIRPAPRWLTHFYLNVALGGAIGGLFVAVVAPVAFPALWEFPILLVLTPALILCKLILDHGDGRAAAEGLTSPTPGRPRPAWLTFWIPWTAASVTVIALGGYLGHGLWGYMRGTRVLTRNFYGALAVSDYADPAVRELSHGTIIHGEQYLDPAKRKTPLTYYSADTGIGLLMTDLEGRGPVSLGVIGLGAGTMAGWGRPGDAVRFYEINRAVLDIARTQFSYLHDCGCEPAVVLGDARLSLEHEPTRQFDVLVVDAFSGDSIPVHLLTREAFAVYFRQLKPDGILAVHVTNTYLNLGRPVAALARSLGREAHLIVNPEDEDTTTFSADWVLIGTDLAARFPWIRDKETAVSAGGRIWTDDFSNLWGALRHDR